MPSVLQPRTCADRRPFILMDATAFSTYLIYPSSERPDSIRGNRIMWHKHLLDFKAWGWTAWNLIYLLYTSHYAPSCCYRAISSLNMFHRMHPLQFSILKQKWHVQGSTAALKICGIVEKVKVQTECVLECHISDDRLQDLRWAYCSNNHCPGENKNIRLISGHTFRNISSS